MKQETLQRQTRAVQTEHAHLPLLLLGLAEHVAQNLELHMEQEQEVGLELEQMKDIQNLDALSLHGPQ
jgi:hypothetical protein